MNDEVQKVCPTCGVAYCLPTHFDAARREDHATWYCPNGHSLHYPGESEKDRTIRELSERVQNLEANLESSRGYFRRRVAELEHDVRSLRSRLAWANRRRAA